MKILPSPAVQAVRASHAKAMAEERAELQRGKITIRWLQHSAAFFIFSGNTRPYIQGFTNPDEAEEYLQNKHNIYLEK